MDAKFLRLDKEFKSVWYFDSTSKDYFLAGFIVCSMYFYNESKEEKKLLPNFFIFMNVYFTI